MLTATQIVDHLKAGTTVAMTKASAEVFINWLNKNKIEMTFQMEVQGEKARLIPIKEEEKPVPFKMIKPKLRRNALCACGSGKKYKKCCLK